MSNAPHSRQHAADVRDAVNFVFTLMRDGFPQQFINAFPSPDDRDRARSLWAKGLQDLHPQQVKKAAIRAIKESRFLPSLSELRRLASTHRYGDLGLLDPLLAYYEACRATNRTRDGAWSHIAVYLAGQQTGWQLLESEPQTKVYPIFERNYEIISTRLMAGENLDQDIPMGLENQARRDALYQAEVAAERMLRQEMVQRGIDPDGGRAEFLHMLSDL